MKRLLSIIIVLCLAFSTGCSKEPNTTQSTISQTAISQKEENPASLGTTVGYVPSQVECPDWLNELWGWDTYGDTIWIGSASAEKEYVAVAYNTIDEHWEKYAIDTADALNPIPESFSVSGNSIWILFRESYTREDIINGAQLADLKYYISYFNIDEAYSQCREIPFAGSENSESSDAVFCSIQALDSSSALLTTYSEAYLIDPEINLMGVLDSTLTGYIVNMRIDDKLYMFEGDDLVTFDKNSRQYTTAYSFKYSGRFGSNNGSFLESEQKTLFKYNPESKEKTAVFNWLDVALSYDKMGENCAFENSNGDFFYPTEEGIIKVTQQQIPQKKLLTLVCVGDSRNEQNSSYRCTKELMDAIIRFNNTDNEFKINVTPVTYSDERERERLLVELATSDSADLIDTSLLPENSIKAGFLVDLLPYIDADEMISRADFIPSLLSAMSKNERLYEYTDKFTLLTMLTNQDLYREHELWTVSEIQSLVESGVWSCESRDVLLEKFVLASTAEFIDWNTMSCSFNCDSFKNWLNLLKEQPETVERYEQPLVFRVTSDFAGDAGLWAKTIVEGNYEVSGFPDTEFTGSYFVKLNSIFDYESPTVGENTRIGIMAASKNQDAAWRFVRTLMLGEQDSNIAEGIPVLKSRFEKALRNSLSNEVTNQGIAVFDEHDAEMVREQVYNTTKLVHEDEALLRIIRSEANMFFAGQKNLDDAAQQIQSRVSIYLAEQYG